MTPDPGNPEWYERFSLDPVDPGVVRDRIAGDALVTVDLPGHLGRALDPDAGPGDALYRLVQLFGTPNVPTGTAGGDRSDRHRTTWQYLFEIDYDAAPDEDAPDAFLLSVYDYETDVSAGVAAWKAEPSEPGVREPVPDASSRPAVAMPDEPYAVGLVQLALQLVDRPVPATYEELLV